MRPSLRPRRAFTLIELLVVVVIIAIIAAGSAVAVGVSRHRRTSHAIIRWLGGLPLLNRFAGHLDEMYESTYTLMEPRGLVLMTALSVAAGSFLVLLALLGHGVSAPP